MDQLVNKPFIYLEDERPNLLIEKYLVEKIHKFNHCNAFEVLCSVTYRLSSSSTSSICW